VEAGSKTGARDDASWALIGLTGLCFLALQAAQPFRIDAGGLLAPAGILLLLHGASVAARLASKPHPLASALPFFRQVVAFSCIAAVLSYQVAAHGGALWDHAFRAWDLALGFDARPFFAFLEARPLLAALNKAMYHSLIPQLVTALLALAWFGKTYEMRILMFASIASGLAAVLLSAAFPGMGNLYDPADYPNLGSSAAWIHRGDIAGLRDGTLRVLDLGSMQGIVTFPSYHAALATIYIAAFRSVPVLRWVGGGWALLTLVSTPAGGGHYLVDVIAGVALALAALKAARRAVFWNAERALRTMSGRRSASAGRAAEWRGSRAATRTMRKPRSAPSAAGPSSRRRRAPDRRSTSS
jgi:membrane-associated phospholipid phosphatase